MFYLYTVLVIDHSPANFDKLICVRQNQPQITRFDTTYLRPKRCRAGERNLGTLGEMVELRREITYGLPDRFPGFAFKFIDAVNINSVDDGPEL